MKNLIKLIKQKKASISIIGLGYVGLPLAIKFSKLGFDVYGYENDSKKISSLNKNVIYVDTIQKADFIRVKDKKFKFGNNFNQLSNSDIFIICVPTPITKNKSPDMRFLNESKKIIKKLNLKNKAIILESTTYPGTTEELFLPIIKLKKLKIGKDVSIIYSPERIDPGNKNFRVDNTPKIVSGHTNECLKISKLLYKNITNIFAVSNIKTAEFTKILENVYRSINIGFVNEMKKICYNFKIDINDVIKTAKSKPFGFLPFYPGPGLGGHCIPIDPFYLSWKAKKLKIKTEFIELAGKINRSMPAWIISQILIILKKKKLGDLKNKKILISGIAYKKNINDCRESPAFEFMKILISKGAKVNFYDPYIKLIPKLRNYSFINNKSITFNQKNLKKFDFVILVTDHDKIDYKFLYKNSKLIFDTRNKFKNKKRNIYHL